MGGTRVCNKHCPMYITSTMFYTSVWIVSLPLSNCFSYISTAIDRTYVPWWLVHGMFFACLMLEPLAPLILEPTIEDLSKKFPVGPYGTQLQINLLDWDLRHSLLHLGHQVMKQETPIIHDRENFSLSLSLSLSIYIYIYIYINLG